ncbi:hypothetical protein ACLBXJ_15585 [Methylobacterium mesophilicum]
MSRVDVYRNLNRACWSVRENRRVVDHVVEIALYDVKFHVSEAARQRVLRLGQRAVLAWASGIIIDAPLQQSSDRIKFDPFEGPHFMVGEWPVHEASLVHFLADGSCWGVL